MRARLDILLVSDDHSELALLGMAIDESEFNIWLQTANDVQRAVDYLEGRESFDDRQMHPIPDLIILDLDMPLSGGFDFLDWRRSSRSFSKLPVLILSGSAYPGAIEAALSLGANASITKPCQVANWKPIVDRIWEFGLTTPEAALDKRL